MCSINQLFADAGIELIPMSINLTPLVECKKDTEVFYLYQRLKGGDPCSRTGGTFKTYVDIGDLHKFDWLLSVIKNAKFNSTQVTVRYILSQKNELELLNKIALLLNGKVHYVKSYNGYNMVVNLTKLTNILKYLKVHKLKTKKLISYIT